MKLNILYNIYLICIDLAVVQNVITYTTVRYADLLLENLLIVVVYIMGKPRCTGCKKLGSMTHTLTKVVVIRKRVVWFNEKCWIKYENRKK